MVNGSIGFTLFGMGSFKVYIQCGQSPGWNFCKRGFSEDKIRFIGLRNHKVELTSYVLRNVPELLTEINYFLRTQLLRKLHVCTQKVI